jgi:DNA-binding CsgD family transcriptional regulator
MTQPYLTALPLMPQIGTAAFEALIGATGMGDLGDVLLQISRAQGHVGELFAYQIEDDGCPSPIVSAGSLGSSLVRATLYAREFHPFDPLRPLLIDAVEGAPIALCRFSASEIADQRYRVECFERPQLGAKLCFVQRKAQRTLVLNFYRSTGRREADCDHLAQLAQVALPILRKHAELVNSGESLAPVTRIGRRLSRAFPALTAREREVCARTIIGMTAEGIGLDLDIGVSSVITYRRRACSRFGFSSPAQFAVAMIA